MNTITWHVIMLNTGLYPKLIACARSIHVHSACKDSIRRGCCKHDSQYSTPHKTWCAQASATMRDVQVLKCGFYLRVVLYKTKTKTKTKNHGACTSTCLCLSMYTQLLPHPSASRPKVPVTRNCRQSEFSIRMHTKAWVTLY